MRHDRSRWTQWMAMAAVAGSITLPVLADSGPSHQIKQNLPISLGTSGGDIGDISRAFCCGGTLGSAVTYDGLLHILSNNHILARSGSATAGEDAIQPGLIDNACSAAGTNHVGDFIGNVVPLGSGIGGHNVDAALALAVSGAVNTSGNILDVGVPCSTIRAADAGLINAPIMKSGRTTGCSIGTVTSVSTSVQIQYQAGCNSGKKFKITYTDQIATTNISAGGDSGSLIVTQAGIQPTALLYAGSSTTTIGNPVQHVIDAFQAGGHTFSFVGNTNRCGITETCPAAAGVVAAVPAPAGLALGHPSDSDVDYARRVKEAHEPLLFARPDVLGVGVGADETDSTRAVIVLYVEASGNARPHGLPAELDGVRVRVITTDPIVAQ